VNKPKAHRINNELTGRIPSVLSSRKKDCPMMARV
jgi:hypothetical protein